jgi:stearoyl-CoA desaturase (Delta-9 desaturase)
VNILASPRTSPDAPMTFGAKAALTAGLTVPFVAVLGTVYFFWRRLVGPTELVLFAFFYAYTVFGMTVGFHRLLTHRAFETGPVVKFLLAVGGTMCLQGPVILWVAIHRRHHQVSDRDGDPHSPHLHGDSLADKIRGFWHAHIGWLYHPDPVDMVRSVPDMMNDPIIRFVDRTAYFWFFLGLALPTGIAYAINPTPWSALSGFIWGGLVRIFSCTTPRSA